MKTKSQPKKTYPPLPASWTLHEFKNSLYSIKSFIDLLPDKHSDKDFMETFVKLVSKEVSRCQKILNGLTDSSSDNYLSNVKINVYELLTDSLAIMNGGCAKRHVQVKLYAPEEDIYCYADYGSLKQVFVNLIKNALEAMPEGGNLSIQLRQLSLGRVKPVSCVEIDVKDSGKGIARKALEKIFEPFYTTRIGEGTGLGLTISRKIIDQYGGNISVQSQLNSGTCFTVRLPAL